MRRGDRSCGAGLHGETVTTVRGLIILKIIDIFHIELVDVYKSLLAAVRGYDAS